MSLTLDDNKYINDVIAFAQKSIYAHTGKKIKVYAIIPENSGLSPLDVLSIVATSNYRTIEDIRVRSNKPEYTMLRIVATHFLKQVFPQIKLTQIGKLLGGYHHTTILFYISQADAFAFSSNVDFTQLADRAQCAIDKALKTEEANA